MRNADPSPAVSLMAFDATHRERSELCTAPARLLVCSLALAAAGCPPFAAVEQDEQRRSQLWRLTGTVSGADGPAVVSLLRETGAEHPYAVEDQVIVRAGLPFVFFAIPAEYVIIAFADTDGNLRRDEGERSGWIPVTPHTVHRDGPDRLRVSLREEPSYPRLGDTQPEVGNTIHFGTRATLSDARFGRDVSELALWEPLRFILDHGGGVFTLAPIDADRTPVIFVHGMGGTPTEFREMIARLPATEFQAWVAHYPSGWELEAVSRYFAQILTVIQARHGLDRVCLVAHSMGGLVSRRALGIHIEQGAPTFVRGLITIASPMGGHPSARLGVQLAPAVVPAWRSLTPGSEFLTAMHRVPLRPETRYALVFTYEDEVVEIAQQLPSVAQAEANIIRGYALGHTDALLNEEVADFVIEELRRCRAASAATDSRPSP